MENKKINKALVLLMVPVTIGSLYVSGIISNPIGGNNNNNFIIDAIAQENARVTDENPLTYEKYQTSYNQEAILELQDAISSQDAQLTDIDTLEGAAEDRPQALISETPEALFEVKSDDDTQIVSTQNSYECSPSDTTRDTEQNIFNGSMSSKELYNYLSDNYEDSDGNITDLGTDNNNQRVFSFLRDVELDSPDVVFAPVFTTFIYFDNDTLELKKITEEAEIDNKQLELYTQEYLERSAISYSDLNENEKELLNTNCATEETNIQPQEESVESTEPAEEIEQLEADTNNELEDEQTILLDEVQDSNPIQEDSLEQNSAGTELE